MERQVTSESQWLFEWLSRGSRSQFAITLSSVMTNTITVSILYLQSVLLLMLSSATSVEPSSREECKLRPIIHHLKYPGCVPKSIPSFACQGQCSSYVQVRGRISNMLLLSTDWIPFEHQAPSPLSDMHHLLSVLDNETGLWLQVLAGGAILHVLPGNGRTGGHDRHLLSKAKSKVPKGLSRSVSFFHMLLQSLLSSSRQSH